MQTKIISFAVDFTSYFLQKVKSPEKVKHILLFGSVARGEAKIESDIDLFIDVEKGNWEKEIHTIKGNFLKSTKYRNYWEPLGIKNELSLKVGVLEDWKELHTSMATNALILYGKYLPKQSQGKHQALFLWENITPASKRVSIFRQLFGFQRYEQTYSGLLAQYGGSRLGKGCISVPLEHAQKFQDLFTSYKVTVKIKRFIEYEK